MTRPVPRVRRGKPRPAFPSLGGSGRLRDRRLACFGPWDSIGASRRLDVPHLVLKPREQLRGFLSTVYRRVRTGSRTALMRINIWIVLIVLIALLAVTRLLRYQQDTQRICADDPSASVCER
jgi:hypothetical protein